MLRPKLLLLLTMILIASCQSTTVPVDTACSWVKPISTTAAERKSMTRETKQEIVNHNAMVDLKCGSAQK